MELIPKYKSHRRYKKDIRNYFRRQYACVFADLNIMDDKLQPKRAIWLASRRALLKTFRILDKRGMNF